MTKDTNNKISPEDDLEDDSSYGIEIAPPEDDRTVSPEDAATTPPNIKLINTPGASRGQNSSQEHPVEKLQETREGINLTLFGHAHDNMEPDRMREIWEEVIENATSISEEQKILCKIKLAYRENKFKEAIGLYNQNSKILFDSLKSRELISFPEYFKIIRLITRSISWAIQNTMQYRRGFDQDVYMQTPENIGEEEIKAIGGETDNFFMGTIAQISKDLESILTVLKLDIHEEPENSNEMADALLKLQAILKNLQTIFFYHQQIIAENLERLGKTKYGKLEQRLQSHDNFTQEDLAELERIGEEIAKFNNSNPPLFNNDELYAITEQMAELAVFLGNYGASQDLFEEAYENSNYKVRFNVGKWWGDITVLQALLHEDEKVQSLVKAIEIYNRTKTGVVKKGEGEFYPFLIPGQEIRAIGILADDFTNEEMEDETMDKKIVSATLEIYIREALENLRQYFDNIPPNLKEAVSYYYLSYIGHILDAALNLGIKIKLQSKTDDPDFQRQISEIFPLLNEEFINAGLKHAGQEIFNKNQLSLREKQVKIAGLNKLKDILPKLNEIFEFIPEQQAIPNEQSAEIVLEKLAVVQKTTNAPKTGTIIEIASTTIRRIAFSKDEN